MTHRRSITRGIVLLLGSVLAWPSLSQAACTINPTNPTVTAGGSIAWSVTNITGISGSSSNFRYSWSFNGGNPTPTSSTSRSPTVTYSATGSSTANLTVRGSNNSSTSCSRAFTVAPQPTISINDVTVTEGQTANFTVSLSAASSQTVTVRASTADDSAKAPGDYTARSNVTLTFAPGTTTQTFAVTTINDTAVESTEKFKVNLSSATNATINDFEGVGTINDNDTPAQASLSINDVTVTEGGTANFTVTRSGTTTTAVSVVAGTANGSAVAGSDYTARANVTLNFAANVTTQTFAVTTLNDAVGEPTETFNVNLTNATNATIGDAQGVGTINDNDAVPNVSINSTSVDSAGIVTTPVAEQSKVISNSYSVLAINDLGMHCGDLDTRIASILPPFQVLLAQVIQKGAEPTLNPAGVSLYYSAASNPNDPVLSQAGVFTGVKVDGRTYKTNFWATVAKGAYDPFYPGGKGITPLATGGFPTTADIGLPVPNVENLYIGPDGIVNSGDETLTAVQHAMPGLSAAYLANSPQLVEEFYRDKPFFVNFPFGYVANDVSWHEGAGVPFAAWDDFGRQNPYPLVRVQAKNASGTVLSTVDTVLPISGEASCVNCHGDPADVPSSPNKGVATSKLLSNGLPVASSFSDPDSNMPDNVSAEYGSDINVLRLHDLKHGSKYVSYCTTAPCPADACTINSANPNGTASCLTNKALVQQKPVVCQVCHYTPALDLAQVGPKAGAPGTEGNGRNQVANQSNSRVMHNHHGTLGTAGFPGLFPQIPSPIQDANGNITNQTTRLANLDASCYQCHPGTATKCLRGAMFNGGMLCNDCHGSMVQVGADFTGPVTDVTTGNTVPGSLPVSPTNPGDFKFLTGGNFYNPASNQPRTPWANEPGCGSCHTGDASSNLANTTGVIKNIKDVYGNTDNIRLLQAWKTADIKATPIVPTNKKFAEPVVPATFGTFNNPGAGNPKLYRVSTGHGGVMCEGCHGATHAEWPNANPNANDNVTANQLQSHTGVIIECSTCHGTAMNSQNTLEGPHGMHPVGSNTSFADGGHKNMVNGSNCVGCHGPNATEGGRNQNLGTVLSVAKADRNFSGLEHGGAVAKGQPVGCATCHN